jgi:hypothetical protein
MYRGVFLLLLLCLLTAGCNRPQVTGIETDEIDTSADPLQTSISPQDPIVIRAYEGTPVRWNTSLTRTDTGDGACEILLVTRARIENRICE